MAAMILWSIGAVTAVSVNCGSKHLWQMNEAATCNGNVSHVHRISVRDTDR
jgi:hypothetical protein